MGKCTAQFVNFQGEEFRLECDLDEHGSHRHFFVEQTHDRNGKPVTYVIEWWEVENAMQLATELYRAFDESWQRSPAPGSGLLNAIAADLFRTMAQFQAPGDRNDGQAPAETPDGASERGAGMGGGTYDGRHG